MFSFVSDGDVMIVFLMLSNNGEFYAVHVLFEEVSVRDFTRTAIINIPALEAKEKALQKR